MPHSLVSGLQAPQCVVSSMHAVPICHEDSHNKPQYDLIPHSSNIQQSANRWGSSNWSAPQFCTTTFPSLYLVCAPTFTYSTMPLPCPMITGLPPLPHIAPPCTGPTQLICAPGPFQ